MSKSKGNKIFIKYYYAGRYSNNLKQQELIIRKFHLENISN